MINSKSVLADGTVLDSGIYKYKIVKVLGQGGFGITYLATADIVVGNVPTQGSFAVKEFFASSYCQREGMAVKPQPGREQEFAFSRKDFVDEARKLQTVGSQSPNIVKVNEVFEANGTAYYVMQYINGMSLTALVRQRGALSFSEAVAIIKPIAEAVGVLHKSRINHLDIKPDNIMLDMRSDGQTVPVLIDFGQSIHFKKSGGKTTPKGVMGISKGYTPLEQYAGINSFSPATDIYSLAATLLYMLTGRDPDEASEFSFAKVRGALAGKVPPNALDGIGRAMRVSRDDRTQTVEQFASDLGLHSGGSNTQPISVRPTVTVPWRRIAVAAGIAVVVVLAFLLGARGCHGTSSTQPDADSTSRVRDSVRQAIKDSLRRDSLRKDSIYKISQAQSSGEKQTDNAPSKGQSSSDGPSTTKEPSEITSGVIDFSYGTWRGGISNGKPDGRGTLTFTATHRVDRLVSKVAHPGDYFVANYDNGVLVNGKLYNSKDSLLDSIIP